ncbi:helix-turn-helix domain-containing protein [Nocardia sp. NPDC055321]
MIVHQWTRTEVRALRKAALRQTQEEFADTVGYVTPTVKKWERSTESRPVTGRSAEALDTILARLDPAQLARFSAAISLPLRMETRPSPIDGNLVVSVQELDLPQGEDGDAVKRREFGKLVAAGATTTFIGSDTPHIGRSDVQRLMDAVAALTQEDQRIGGGQLVDFALKQLSKAKHLLDTGSYDIATGNAYTSAVGELAAQAGWLAYDADRHGVARRCYSDALALGAEANDTNVITHACLSSATQMITLSRTGAGSPFHALKLIDRARNLVRGGPPGRVHALIAVRDAQAYAALLDRPAFERAIGTAWRELDYAIAHEPIDACPQWLRFVDHQEILGHEARGSADLGDFDRAFTLFDTVAAEQGNDRNDANLRAWTAVTHVRRGDLTEAVNHALPVVTDFADLSSPRTLRVLEPVRHAVDRLAIGGDFRHQFDTLAEKVITA